MSTRRVHQAPNYIEVKAKDENEKLNLEIRKFKPEVEVTVEGLPELAQGRIIDWNASQKLFRVDWRSITDDFKMHSGLRTGLRNFFRVKLFTSPILFKCELVRRLPDGTFHYRLPEQIYKLQKRGALRVPLKSGTASLITRSGRYAMLDLSIAGARLSLPESESSKHHTFENCTLILGGKKITAPGFQATITSRSKEGCGVRFSGLDETLRFEIKQYLIESLHAYYQEASHS